MKFLYVRESQIDIEFDDFQRCLAMALCGGHPQENLCLAALAEELPKELEAAVFAGKLPVKKPVTMGPQSFPVGDALRTSRVLVDDIRSYVKERGVSVAHMPEVVKQARIQAVDPELLKFPLHAPVYYTDKIGFGNGAGICKVGDFVDAENDRIQRQSEGYFTVDEAAQILADSRPGIDVGEMIQRMKTAVVNGLRLVRNPGDRLPIVNDKDFREYMSVVKVSDVDAWLESQGVDYRFPPATPAKHNKKNNDSSEEWKLKAQRRARAIIAEKKARDLYPNQETVGDLIANEFRSAGENGPDGKPLTGATIKRHALKGITSAVNKQLSTSNSRGK